MLIKTWVKDLILSVLIILPPLILGYIYIGLETELLSALTIFFVSLSLVDDIPSKWFRISIIAIGALFFLLIFSKIFKQFLIHESYLKGVTSIILIYSGIMAGVLALCLEKNRIIGWILRILFLVYLFVSNFETIIIIGGILGVIISTFSKFKIENDYDEYTLLRINILGALVGIGGALILLFSNWAVFNFGKFFERLMLYNVLAGAVVFGIDLKIKDEESYFLVGAMYGIWCGFLVGGLSSIFFALTLYPEFDLKKLNIIPIIILFASFIYYLLDLLMEKKKLKWWIKDAHLISILFSSFLFPLVIVLIFKLLSGVDGLFFLGLFHVFVFTIYWLIPFPIVPIFDLIFTPFIVASKREKNRWELVSAYPNLLCEKHLAKAKKKPLAIFYYDVICRVNGCPSDEFYHVKTVVGVIGRGLKHIKKENDTLYIPLIANGIFRNADVDKIEIREGLGNSINYDKTIDLVIMELKNDISRERDYLKSIVVEIIGNVPISERAKRNLEKVFKEVKFS